MFTNIGGKIKTLAKVLCWIGIIASVICAIVLWTQNSRYNPTIALGFGVLIGGVLSSWIGSFFMYGFGELIAETTLNRQISQSILETMKKQNTDSSWAEVGYDEPIDFSQEGVAQSAIRTGEFLKSHAARWECAECGSMNDSSAIMCKDCGTYK